MENTTTNKEITAEEIKQGLISAFNEHGNFNDMLDILTAFKQQPQKSIDILTNYIISVERSASLQTEAKYREIAVLKAENIHELKRNEEYLNDAVEAEKRVSELESSLSLAKKENEELKNNKKDLEESFDKLAEATAEISSELTSVKEQLQSSKNYRKIWHDNWTKIIDAIPNTSAGCRDCADENGTCPISQLPCDPTEAAITQFNKLQESNTKLVEALEGLKHEAWKNGVTSKFVHEKCKLALSFKADTKNKD